MIKKILKCIITIIAIICIFILLKFILFKSLVNKMTSYETSDNYYMWYSTYRGDVSYTTELWVKNNEMLINFDSGNQKFIIKEGKLYVFIDEEWIDISNTAEEDLMIKSNWNTMNYIKSEIDKFSSIFKYKISSDIINGKKCFKLEAYSDYGDSVYIEKKSGLVIRFEKTFGESTNFGEIIQSTINDYRYEFNNVNNDIIKF